MDLEERIIMALRDFSMQQASIILDGCIFKHSGKRVYVQLNVQKGKDVGESIQFFVKRSQQNELGSDKVYLKDTLEEMKRILQKGSFSYKNIYGLHNTVNLGIGDLDSCAIESDSDMKFLIIESQLYRSVKRLMCVDTEKSYTFMFDNKIVSASDLAVLKNDFTTMSLSSFEDFMYHDGASKFFRKISRHNKNFYQTQHAFVPVFMDYQKVFNPLLNNKVFQNSDLFNLATSPELKNRCREYSGVSGYYLTHLEICRALHLEYFMRFTPAFLYSIFVGLAYPSNLNFPNSGRFVFYNPDKPSDYFPEVIYQQKQIMLQKQLEEAMPHTSMYSSLLTEQKELAGYQRINSLLHACMLEQHRLASVGSISLDKKEDKTYDKYFMYLERASLGGA